MTNGQLVALESYDVGLTDDVMLVPVPGGVVVVVVGPLEAAELGELSALLVELARDARHTTRPPPR